MTPYTLKAMSIDELIEKLKEAKEHGFLGREKVIFKLFDTTIYDVDKIEWDNKNVCIHLY